MSALSDAMAASMLGSDDKPKKKPAPAPMTLEQATALARKRNPLMTLGAGDVGLGLEANKNAGKPLSKYALGMGVAGMNARQDRAVGGMNKTLATDAAPATDVLEKASNLFEAPFSLIGASEIDRMEGRRGVDSGSASQHALALMRSGQFGKARQLYSFTSWDAARRAAKDGDPLAKWALQHPTYGSFLMGGSEFVNPSNLVGGRAAEVLGGLTKAGLTAGGRAAGAAARAVAPSGANLAGNPLYRLSQSLGEASTLSRMGPVRQAAYDEARRAGKSRVEAKRAADTADLTGRGMAQSTETGQSRAQALVKDVFGGLDPSQKQEVMDAIERPPSNLSPALRQRYTDLHAKGQLPPSQVHHVIPPPSTVPDLARRVQAYRTWRGAIDSRTIGNGLAEQGDMWTGAHYFPRRGMTDDPNLNLSEEQEDEIEARRSRGGKNIRRDTLGDRVPTRRYATAAEARAAGVTLNPDWDPAEALYNHAVARERSNILEEGAHALQRLGLVEPLETQTFAPRTGVALTPHGKIVAQGKAAPTSVTPHRSDFLPFTELGRTRQFGSPLLRESAVHPAVVDLIEDLAPQTSQGGLSTAFDTLAAGGREVNNALARVEVSQPLYHIPVNVIPNALMSALTYGADVPAGVRALLKPKAAKAAAEAAGADYPYADREFKAKDLEPGLTPGKAARAIPRALNAVSTQALYKHMQPPIAAAAFAALAPRMGPEAAALEVRSILGEPENLGAREQAGSQAFIFPSWQKSMARRSVRLLGQNPALYQSAHTAVNDRNESRGVSPDAYSWSSLVPPIVTGVSKKGAVTQVPIPGPFNRTLGLIDALGNAATGQGNAGTLARDALNVFNPALGTAARFLWTTAAPARDPSSLVLYDKDAPASVQHSQALQSILGRFNPLRGFDPKHPLSALSSSVGLEPETQLSPAASKHAYVWEQRERGAWDAPRGFNFGPAHHSVEYLRNLATKARKAGGSIDVGGKRYTAAQIDAKADQLYNFMESKFKAFGEAQTR